MPTGGARPGAGRPPSLTGRTHIAKYDRVLALHAERLAQSGLKIPEKVSKLDPLDTMLYIMKMAMAANDHVLALEAAKQCAPYVHPRLSMAMVSHTTEHANPDSLSDDQLHKLILAAQHALTERNTIDMPMIETINAPA